MRVLICGFDSPGFLHPLLFAGQTLVAAGHEVLVVSGPGAEGAVQAAGLRRMPRPGRDGPNFDITNWAHPASAAMQLLHTEAAVRAFGPDVILASILAIGPLFAAERADLPVAVLGQMCHLWPADDLAPEAGDPTHLQWRYAETSRIVRRARAACGLAERSWSPTSLPLNGDRLLLRSVPAVEIQRERLSDDVQFVGPCLWERPGDDATAVSWMRSQPTPVVYAQLGRVFAAGPLWPRLLAALDGGRVRAAVNLARYDGPVTTTPTWVRRSDEARCAPLVDAAAAVVGSATSTLALTALLGRRPLLAFEGGGEQVVVTTALQRLGALRVFDPAEDPARQLADFLACGPVRQRAAALGRQLAAVDSGAAVTRALDRLVSSRPMESVS